MSDFERMAWDYSDSMYEEFMSEKDDVATAYAKGFMAGAKAFTAYLKDEYDKDGDGDFMFWKAERVFNGGDMYDHEAE